MQQNKINILTSALGAREQEILGYQINIDNYTLAIAHIASLPKGDQNELADFKARLESLLTSEILEQKKAKVMQAVIKQQLGV